MTDNQLPIRILPMSTEEPEFRQKTAQEVQQEFFLRDLPAGTGEYWYRKQGLEAEQGTVVLFQYKNQIIASATLIQRERFDEPEDGYPRSRRHGTEMWRRTARPYCRKTFPSAESPRD